MRLPSVLFPTTIAGSLPKPSWLAEPNQLWAPWRLQGEELEAAKDDATLLALKLQEDAGIDIVTDGEQARQHFVHGFLEAVDGIDFDTARRNGHPQQPLQGDVSDRRRRAAAALRVHAREARARPRPHRRKLKFTLPGPMTIVDTIADAHYGDRVKMAMAFADLLNDEARGLAADGVDVIQFDEPAFNVYMDEAAGWASKRCIAPSTASLRQAPCNLLRLRHTGQHRVEGNARWRVAAVREILPGARAEPHRPGLDRVHQLTRADEPADAARRQGRADRHHRCRDRRVETAEEVAAVIAKARAITCRRKISSPAPIAAWRRCGARFRSRSLKRWQEARHWRVRDSADSRRGGSRTLQRSA